MRYTAVSRARGSSSPRRSPRSVKASGVAKPPSLPLRRLPHAARFFTFARKRHEIYLLRADGRQQPWTKDKILREYKFTNVFRELDRTTVWFRHYVRDPLANSPNVLMATVLFRLFNRIETGEAIFLQTEMFSHGKTAWDLFRADGDVSSLQSAIVSHCGDGPYVTGAYMVRSTDGMEKLPGMLKGIGAFWKDSDWRKVADSMVKDRWSLWKAWSWIQEFDLIGPFVAYELVSDLRHTDLLRNANDIMTWANPGPGARRGALRVMGKSTSYVTKTKRKTKIRKASPRDTHLVMVDLLAMSADPQHWPEDWGKWEMREVEHTLCEFDKYERVRLGQGTPKGRYEHE